MDLPVGGFQSSGASGDAMIGSKLFRIDYLANQWLADAQADTKLR